jgi:hypothetical protein
LIVPAVRKYPSIRFLNIVVGLLSVLSAVLDLRPSEKSGANRGRDLLAPLISLLCRRAKCVETTNLHHPSNKSTRSPLPLPTGLLTRIAAQFHHIGNSPRDIVPFPARHHNSSQPVKPVQATEPRLTSSRRTLGASQHLSAQLPWPSQQPSTRDSLKSSSIHTCTWSRKTHLQR